MLMSAVEAGYIAELAKTRHGNDLLYMLDEIKRECRKGKNSYYHSGEIEEEVKNMLQKLGYQILKNPYHSKKDTVTW